MWTLRLAEHLSRRGTQVTLVVHPRPAGIPGFDADVPEGVRVEDLCDLPSLREPGGVSGCGLSRIIARYASVVRNLAQRVGGPVCYCPTLVGDAFGIGAALALTDPASIRVIGWQHSDCAYDACVLRHYEPCISRFVGVSGHIAAGLAARLPARAGDVHTIPCGIPVATDISGRAPLAALTRPLRLVYTGRIERSNKRVHTLVGLSDLLDRRGIAHTLTIVGDGPDAGALAEIIAGEAEGTTVPRRLRVHAAGGREPQVIREILARSDVFVLPSRFEGLSVSMLEAMAEGCVPVVTRVASGAAEVIEDGTNGVLVPVSGEATDDDVASAMCEGVQRVIAGDAAAMAVAAHATVRDQFSIERSVEAVERVFALAASDGPRGWPADRPCAFSAAAGPDVAPGGVHTGGGSGTVPAFGGERLRGALAAIAAAGGRAALHGAGRHTIELAGVLATHGACVVAVTDDDPAACGRPLCGWPVVAPSELMQREVTDVVISSWIHQPAIWARRSVYESQGITVHRLYADAELP